jgi:predicted transcriptional regulator/transcriptional regulator with XRE-family HTH domain
MDKKAMLGAKVRRLRRDQSLTQAQMALRLGISPSYLNLIEHNQRPVTVPLLLRLGQTFGVDLQSFAEDEESRLVAGLREVFADPLFDSSDIKNQDFKEMAAATPTLGQAVVALYQAYREMREGMQSLSERLTDQDKLTMVPKGGSPLEEVRDFLHSHSNHFPELETAAEELWAEEGLEKGDLYRGLVDVLKTRHSVRVRLMPTEVMGSTVRRYDRHARRILVSEMLAPSARNFQIACQIALLRHRDLLNRIVDTGGLSGDETRRLARIGLTNYFAGAVLMPYERFSTAASKVRYDIEILRRRFDASFEQVCHRLTTLQRPGAKGVPFFLIRVDNAGNVSKRFSGSGFYFARSGGACPRWIVYEAFRTPGKVHTQLAQMPDGTNYFSIARTVVKAGGGFRDPPQQFAIALGCDAIHAGQIVYADGMDLTNTGAATPIGVNCRLCERLECSQRAFPPLHHRLLVDENLRGLSPFLFTPARTDSRLAGGSDLP